MFPTNCCIGWEGGGRVRYFADTHIYCENMPRKIKSKKVETKIPTIWW